MRTGGRARSPRATGAFALGLLLLVVLLLVVDPVACKRAKQKRKLRVLRIDKPETCAVMVDDHSVVGFYYAGYFLNGTVATKDTSVVGRPDEIDMRTERDGLLRAIQRGVRGACVGEKRKVVVPPYLYRDESSAADQYPSETMDLRVHVVLVNGTTGEDAASASRAAARAGESASSECGACRIFVKKFVHSWYVALAKNLAKVQNNAGKEPPSLNYNEDMEEMIQTLCTSDTFTRDPTVDIGSAAAFCDKTMVVHKRKMAEQAMKWLTDLERSWLPFSNQVCHFLTQSCPLRREGSQPRCETCTNLVEEARFDLTMQGPSVKAQPADKRAWKILVDMCSQTKFSYGNPALAAEVCEDLVEDHGSALVSFIVETGDSANGTIASGADIRSFCVGAEMCEDAKAEGAKEEL